MSFNGRGSGYDKYFVGCYHHRHVGYDQPWPFWLIVVYALAVPFATILNPFLNLRNKYINLVEVFERVREWRDKEIVRRAHFFLVAKSKQTAGSGGDIPLTGNIWIAVPSTNRADYYEGVQVAFSKGDAEKNIPNFEKFIKEEITKGECAWFSIEFTLERSGKATFEKYRYVCGDLTVSDERVERVLVEQMYLFLKDVTHNHKNISALRETTTPLHSTTTPLHSDTDDPSTPCSEICPRHTPNTANTNTTYACQAGWARKTFRALCRALIENNQERKFAIGNLGYLGYVNSFKNLVMKAPENGGGFCGFIGKFNLADIEYQINSFVRGIEQEERNRRGIALFLSVLISGGGVILGLLEPRLDPTLFSVLLGAYIPLVAFSAVLHVPQLLHSAWAWNKTFLYKRIAERLKEENYKEG